MKKSIVLFVSMLAFVLVSCEDPVQVGGDVPDQQEKKAKDSISFTVTLETRATKTMLRPDDAENLSRWEVLWSEGDEIRVFNADNREGVVFTLVKECAGFSTGTFTGPAITGDGPFYAVYPASAATALAVDGSIGLTVPDTQAYASVDEYIGAGANLSAGYAGSLAEGFTFKNLFGVLSLTVTNAAGIRSVSLYTKGASDVLNGAFTLTGLPEQTPLALPVAGQATEPHQKLTLDCGAGGGDRRVFNIVVPVGMLDAGMTVELYDSEGKAMVMNAGAYSGEGSIIKRSQASPMASFAYVPQYKAAFLASTSQAGAYRNVFADIFEMETYLEYNLSDEVAPVQYAFDNVIPDPADEANPGSRMFRLQGWTPVFYAVGIKLPSYRLEAGETISGAIVTTNLDTDNSASEPGEVKVLKKTASRAWLVGGEGEPAGIDRAGFIIMLTED